MKSLEERQKQRLEQKRLLDAGIKPESGEPINGTSDQQSVNDGTDETSTDTGVSTGQPGPGVPTGQAPAPFTAPAGNGAGTNTGTDTGTDEFSEMTIAQLRQWADDNESPVPQNLTVKADIQQYVRNLKKFKAASMNEGTSDQAVWTQNQ